MFDEDDGDDDDATLTVDWTDSTPNFASSSIPDWTVLRLLAAVASSRADLRWTDIALLLMMMITLTLQGIDNVHLDID